LFKGGKTSSTAQRNAAQRSTTPAQRSTTPAQPNATQHNAAQRSTTQHNAAQRNATQRNASRPASLFRDCAFINLTPRAPLRLSHTDPASGRHLPKGCEDSRRQAADGTFQVSRVAASLHPLHRLPERCARASHTRTLAVAFAHQRAVHKQTLRARTNAQVHRGHPWLTAHAASRVS
jgi:hypothetical protein